MAKPSTHLAAALLLATALAGCGALYTPEHPATGVGFMLGELQATLDAQPSQVAAATQAAFASLGIHAIYARPAERSAEVEGRTADGQQIMVRVNTAVDGRSYVRIRVGSFGDEGLSRAIFERICEPLAAPRPASPGGLMLPIPPSGGAPSREGTTP